MARALTRCFIAAAALDNTSGAVSDPLRCVMKDARNSLGGVCVRFGLYFWKAACARCIGVTYHAIVRDCARLCGTLTMFVHCELLTHRSRSDCTWNRYGRSAKSSSIAAT